MPSLVIFTMKAKQLEALRIVRRQAASTYKSSEEREVQRRGGGGRGNLHVTSTTGKRVTDETPTQDKRRDINQVYFQRGPYLHQ